MGFFHPIPQPIHVRLADVRYRIERLRKSEVYSTEQMLDLYAEYHRLKREEEIL